MLVNDFVLSEPVLLALAFAGGLIVAAIVASVRGRRLRQHNRMLMADLDDATTRLIELKAEVEAKARHAHELEQTRSQLTHEFRELAGQLLEERSRQFAHANQASMGLMLQPFRDQIDAFQKRVNQIHDDTQRGHAALGTEIRRVADMGLQIGEQADRLATALRGDSKVAGNWGEMLLERCLQMAGLEKDVHYHVQPSFTAGPGQRLQPDFVVDLPDRKSVVIDSKVSLAAYDRAVACDDEAEAQRFMDEHVRAVKQHIDDLARKGYARLPHAESPGFVLMYMPVEAAAMAALRHNGGLVEYAWRKDVMLVSSSTLMPVLRLVASAWATDRTHKEARELARQAGDIHTQVVRVAERFRRLGATLGTASRHYNEAVTALAGQQGLAKKVSRFAGLASQAPEDMPALQTLSDHQMDAEQSLKNVRENPRSP